MRRRDETRGVYLPTTLDELAVLDELAAMLGLTRVNVLRTALWSLADYQQIAMGAGVFDLRHSQGQWTRNPKLNTHEPAPRTYAKPKKPAKDHPWRGVGIKPEARP